MDTFDLSAFFVPKGEIVTHNQKTQEIMERIRRENPKRYSEKMVLHLAVKEQERELNEKIDLLVGASR